MLKHQNTIDTSFIISIPMLFNIFLILCNMHTLCFSQYCCCLVVAEIMACARDPNSRDRDRDRDVQPRDRDETETLAKLVETRPRRDLG